MSVEENFIEGNLDRARLEEFLEEELEEAGYGGVEIRKAPMGTRVTLYVQRPGVVIGRGGRNVQDLTERLDKDFDLDDPQVEVDEIETPEFNASIMANRVAFLLTKGLYFRRVGYGTLREIMDAGARGAEIVISGKLTGDFAREERFYDGYLKKAGHSASKQVSTGQAVAELPAGTVGVKVRIMPPDVRLPDEIEVRERDEIEGASELDEGEEEKSGEDEEPPTETGGGESEGEEPEE